MIRDAQVAQFEREAYQVGQEIGRVDAATDKHRSVDVRVADWREYARLE